jgi:hypothetical protein
MRWERQCKKTRKNLFETFHSPIFFIVDFDYNNKNN